MHIPDGYLSPQTYVPAYAAMVPIWAAASKKLNKTLRTRQVPLLALSAAFSFVLMMFNIPALGFTGHAVGAVLIAILLGPWAATVAVSLVLIVQAFLFGDGGVTAIGANCINMAVIMPWVGWGVYRLIAGSSPAKSSRQWIGGFVGGYIGLNAAALTTAIMFGIQPLIAKGYCPYNLKTAITAVGLGHLLVFGWIEAIATGLVVAYLQRVDPSLLKYAQKLEASKTAGRQVFRKIALGLVLLIFITPLGLYLPAKFAAGTAWGEWSAQEIEVMTGHVPSGMQRLGSLWHHSLMPDYALPSRETAPLAVQSVNYVLAGVIGAVVLVVLIFVLKKFIARKEPDEHTT